MNGSPGRREIFEGETQTCLWLRRASGRKEKITVKLEMTSGITPGKDKRKEGFSGQVGEKKRGPCFFESEGKEITFVSQVVDRSLL